MNYTYELTNDVLFVSLEGRLDTETSAKFEVAIAEICKENVHGSLVLDASKLEYIASSGLRIMLKMVKTEKNFRIVNVSPMVYNVFDVTGFSKIIIITKALRKIDLEKCERAECEKIRRYVGELCCTCCNVCGNAAAEFRYRRQSGCDYRR